MQYIKNECECFIRGSKHRETDESTRPQAECFYCFSVFGTPDETRSISFWYSFLNELPTIIVCYFCFLLLIKQQLQNVIKMVQMECAIWKLANLSQFNNSVFCARWMSQVQGFGFPKLLTRKRSVLSVLFRNLRFTETNGRYRFFENGKAKERTRFAPLTKAECSRNVQELTESIENENAKSLN